MKAGLAAPHQRVAGKFPRHRKREAFVLFYRGQDLRSVKMRIEKMYNTYRTTKETIFAEEIENADITLKLIIDLQKKVYLIIKRQQEVKIYTLSLIGDLTEFVYDVCLVEYREHTYTRLDKEAIEQGFKPRKREFATSNV